MTTRPNGIPPAGIDAERIARVLDGRATADERARLLAEADGSPELLAVLADTAAIMNESAGATDGIIPIDARRRRGMPRVAWIAAAAAAIVAVTIPMVRRAGDGLVPEFPVAFATTFTPLADARAGAALSPTRGAGSGSRASQSVVIGARVVDYVVLQQAADSSAATVAIEIAAGLRSMPGGAAAATRFDAPGVIVTQDVLRATAQAVDAASFRAAGWVELARLAASSGDSATLTRADLRSAIERLAGSATASTEARRLAAELGKALGAVPMDPARIKALASDLLLAMHSGR